MAMPSTPLARTLAWTVLVGAFALGSTSTVDMDFHWHLAQGQGLVQTGGFPAADPFTHLPVDHAPDRQAWLSDAIFAIAYRFGGMVAIRVLAGLVLALGAGALWRWARDRTGSLAAASLAVAAFAALAEARFRLRPDLFTLALVPVLVRQLDGVDRDPSPRRFASLFALASVWVNLHPGALAGGILALAHAPTLDRRALLRRLGAAICVVAGLCLSFDGPRGLLAFTSDTTPLRPLIPEWQRLWERPFAEFRVEWVVVGAITMSSIAALAFDLRRAATTRERCEVVLGWACPLAAALLAATAVRFLFMLVIPLTHGLRVFTSEVGGDGAPAIRLRWVAPSIGVAAAVLVTASPMVRLHAIGGQTRIVGAAYLTSADIPPYPVEAADYLAKSKLAGNLGHPPKWGGYLAWKLAPRFRTATDGRVTFFGRALAAEWVDEVQGPHREEVFTRRDVEILVMPAGFLPRDEWGKRWLPAFVDSSGTTLVFVRTDGPHAEQNLSRVARAGPR